MSRWFRHYAGMMRDEKLVRAAVHSKQPVERVVWVWGAILESAAELNNDGRYELDTGEAAYFLRCDASELVAILDSLEGLGRLCDGMVAKWGERQYVSDGSRERQQRYRDRRKAGADVQQRNGDNRKAESDVTPPSRDAEVTLQDTRSREQIQKEDASASKTRARKTDPEFEDWYSRYPHKVQRGAAEKAFVTARRLADLGTLISGLHRYIATKPEDRQWQNPATWLNGKGWLDEPGAVAIRNAQWPPGGKRMNAVEANLSLRSHEHEQIGERRDFGDVELLPPDKPGLSSPVADLGKTLRWPG